jgi:hypothetical protein
MFDNLQKYWKIWSAIATGLVMAIGWVISMENKTPKDVEEMIEIRNAVQAMPTKGSRAVDSLNDVHAVTIRQLRYEDNKRADSIKAIYDRKKDSTTLDYIKRFTVQIEQLEEKIDKHNN